MSMSTAFDLSAYMLISLPLKASHLWTQVLLALAISGMVFMKKNRQDWNPSIFWALKTQNLAAQTQPQ